MKQVFLISYFLFFVSYCRSQNLIPNPSFEIYDTCPYNSGQLNFAQPWFSANSGTPDYFNTCNTGFFNIPSNLIGYQYARTGNAYSGFGFYSTLSSSSWREYIEIELPDTLESAKKYCLSFYVSLANNSKYGISNIEAYFSNSVISYSGLNYLNVYAQVKNDSSNILLDTTNWILISGNFTATGGEKYLTIGNFHNNANSTIDSITGNFQPDAYYYIDDVSLLEIINVYAGEDTIICNGNSVQLGNASYQGVTYSWQPTTGLSNANIGNPTASPAQTTTYYLTQTTACNINTDTVTVTVCDKPSITMPNIFTPNNDGINDEFKITSKKITTLNCKIYNRWGILVSELTKINEGWDGRSTSGLQCTTGVYYYILTAMGEDGKEYNDKGFVSLVK